MRRLIGHLQTAILMIIVFSSGAHAAGTATTLWSFNGPAAAPYAVTYYQGAIYGTANEGAGIIFELSAPAKAGGAWTRTVLYGFEGSAGSPPPTSLVFDSSGAMYGVGGGGIFQLMPPASPGAAWIFNLIYTGSFALNGSLEVGSDGVLYGTDGSGLYGDVFTLTPPAAPGGAWTHQTIYTFTGGADGSSPYGPLAFGPGGVVYGASGSGGSAGYGTIFQLTPPSTPGGAWSETTLYTFMGLSDGESPYNGVIAGANGAIYGTTALGEGGGNCPAGTDDNCGLAFELTESGGVWTYSVIHQFQGPPKDGSIPSTLIAGAKGVLYGITTYGGACQQDCGTVYELDPPAVRGGAWTETLLHEFQSPVDGALPVGLTADTKGNLYAAVGDDGHNGLVVELAKPRKGAAWKESILFNFAPAADAATPYSGLVADSQGNLYGTTSAGGGGSCPGQGLYSANPGCGTVYQMAPPASGGSWTESVIYNFTGGADGWSPYASVVIGPDGALYGTTLFGGANGRGTVFRLQAPAVPGGAWTEKTLYSFKTRNDATGYGWVPLVFDSNGTIYGASYDGGKHSRGAVYQLTPPSSPDGAWTESVLYSFTGAADSEYPRGLVFTNGSLFGSNEGSSGGYSTDGKVVDGTMFQLTPPASPGGAWTETTLHTFAGGSDGLYPTYGPIVDSQGNLYGVTLDGGTGCKKSNCGVVYELTPPAISGGVWTETIIHDFTGSTDGQNPNFLSFDGDTLLVTAGGGGPDAGGTVIQLTPSSSPGGAWTSSVLGALGGAAGSDPLGVVLYNGALYGVNADASATRYGNVFQLTF